MGAAGDMLMAALYELLDDKQTFLDTMRGLGLPGIEISAEPAVKCGITGTHMKVLVHGSEELDSFHEHLHGCEHDHAREPDHAHTHAGEHEHHHHTGLHEIEHLLSHLDLPQTVRDDALADVVGVCLLMHLLAPEKVYASSVHVGCGRVKCAHGILPVPAPATALLLSGVPIYGGAIQGELCTPTGAALLTHFVTKFGELPAMRLLKSGYGMGTKDFPAANCVRAMLGEQDAPAEEILELSCNLDDCTGEAIGFAMERLLDAGALDVYWTSVGMKKNRPGILLTCMCRPLDREKMVELLFRHTTTLGVRESAFRRYTLSRESKTIQTPDGDIRVKVSTGYGVTREKSEFDDLAKIARETGKSLSELQRSI